MGLFANLRSTWGDNNEAWFCQLPELRELDETHQQACWRACKRAVGSDLQYQAASWITWLVAFGLLYLMVSNSLLHWGFLLGGFLLVNIVSGLVQGLISHRLYHSHLPRFLPDHCRQCGYDLRVSPAGACPECGRQPGRAIATPFVTRLAMQTGAKPMRSFQLASNGPPVMPAWFAEFPELMDVEEFQLETLWFGCHRQVQRDWRYWAGGSLASAAAIGTIITLLRMFGVHGFMPIVILSIASVRLVADRVTRLLHRNHLPRLIQPVCLFCDRPFPPGQRGVCESCKVFAERQIAGESEGQEM